MSFRFPHKIQVTPIARNVTFGTNTEGTSVNYVAQIEQEDKIRYGSDGQPLEPRTFFMLPPDAVIVEGDKIKITEMHGEPVTDSLEYFAMLVFPVGGSKRSHFEVVA